jgi:hypothetical protein
MTYGVLRYHPAAFDVSDNPVTEQDAFDRSVEQYTFLKKNAAAIAISSGGLRLMPFSFADSSYTPSIWPVLGHITDSFGERLDPFSGERAFHTGVDVASDYGAPVHVTADGVVISAENTLATAACSGGPWIKLPPVRIFLRSLRYRYSYQARPGDWLLRNQRPFHRPARAL